MSFGNVVNQFHNQNRFADPGAAEQTDFAAFGIGLQQIDHFNTGRQDLGFGRLFGKRGRWAMNRKIFFGIDLAAAVHRFAHHIDNPSQQCRTDRNFYRFMGIDDFQPAGQPVGRIHRNGSDHAFAQLLFHFQHQSFALIVAFQCGIDVRQIVGIVKLDVDDGSHYLKNISRLFLFIVHKTLHSFNLIISLRHRR